MGGRPHGLAVGRPFRLDGFPLAARAGRPSATARIGAPAGAGRAAGGRRRARRPPRRQRPDPGAERRRAARRPSARRRRDARPAGHPRRSAASPTSSCSAISSTRSTELEETLDAIAARRRPRPSRPGRRSDRGDLPLRRPHRVPRSRRPASRHVVGRAEQYRDDYQRAARRAPRAADARSAAGSTGRSSSTAPTGRRPSRCSPSTPASPTARTPRPASPAGAPHERLPFAFTNAGDAGRARSRCRSSGTSCALTPPKPRLEQFPPTRLLLEIARKEEQPARSPWWLTALRLPARRRRDRRPRRAGLQADRRGRAGRRPAAPRRRQRLGVGAGMAGDRSRPPTASSASPRTPTGRSRCSPPPSRRTSRWRRPTATRS